ncbi:MAG TPA: hypothetical protein DCO79_10765, partial [Spirochaeta sp.]|nr:hypothetical protein [Spirochaeta sp.]
MSGIDSYTALSGILGADDIKINDSGREWFEAVESGRTDYLPFLTTGYYLDTAINADEKGRAAILRQIIPDVREFDVKEYELADPLGEKKFSPVPRFVHRYPDRALILVTDRCAMYCRHCFRRSFSGGMHGALTDKELAAITDYLAAHTEIKEILLTGGDPLTLPDSRLISIIASI